MRESFGKYLLSEAIPAEYRPNSSYDKKSLSKAMTRMAKADPDAYIKTITQVKRLGDEFATHEGISVGLDDIEPLYAARDKIVKPALRQLKTTKDRAKRVKIITDTQKKLQPYAQNHPGTMGMMARSGGRGNVVQLMKAVGSPVAAGDEKDNVQPWLITKSYSEGLNPAAWWVTNREARMSAVKSNIEVVEPGDLSKILVNNMSSNVVTTADCGTKNGLSFSVTDSALLDRYTAKDLSGYPAGTLLTARVLETMKKRNIKSVVARSPMTCEVGDGVCQKCAGLSTTGALNSIGTNVGIRAAQSLGEPLTQLALDAKHGVRMAGKEHQAISGLEGFRAIIESPASFKNKATLAPLRGTVTKIQKAPQGGHNIWVGDQKQYIAQHLKPVVKVGDKVSQGDALSSGVPRPDEVVQHKGLGAGREYIVNQLQGIYSGAGINVDRRHLEVLAKSNLNYLRIDDVDDEDSAEHGLVRGDIIDYNRFRNVIAKNIEELPITKAEGRHLGEGALQHVAGTPITPDIVRDLKRAGIKKVKVTMRAPTVSPIMAPATRNPLLNPDFVVRLGHRYLKQTLLDAAQFGQTTNIHGTQPVPGLVFSNEFGEGMSGKY